MLFPLPPHLPGVFGMLRESLTAQMTVLPLSSGMFIFKVLLNLPKNFNSINTFPLLTEIQGGTNPKCTLYTNSVYLFPSTAQYQAQRFNLESFHFPGLVLDYREREVMPREKAKLFNN